MISLIWAQTRNGVIGINNSLPWKIAEEMKHFKNTTINHDILMGSKTFDSLNQKPLKNRLNYVLTKNPEKYSHLNFDNLVIINSIEPILDKYKTQNSKILYIIGGKVVFNLFFKFADEIIKTTIYQEYDGDTYIPFFDFSSFKKTKENKFEEFKIEYFERK